MSSRWTFLLLPLVAIGACSERTSQVIGFDSTRDGQGFGTPDAGGVEGQDASTSEPVLMCPVTTCSLPWATCPTSKFPCDIDLLNDNDNCGGCGISCSDGTPLSNWSCVEGKCTFGCERGYADCDGDPTNGCEASLGDSSSCGDCGNKCPGDSDCQKNECVNGCLQGNKPDICDDECTNLDFDNYNCGTCGTVCDPTGPNLPPLPDDMYYGCGAGVCGRRRCAIPNAADCNGRVSDGCEVMLHTNENCNSCGDACPPGKECRQLSVMGSTFGCLCEDDGEALCPRGCTSLDDDPTNCGGCDRVCPGMYRPHFSAICTHGVCGGQCSDGYADCDKIAENGCEVDTRVDNRNCGACGHACLPDQACSAGKCVVAPCDGAPGETK